MRRSLGSNPAIKDKILSMECALAPKLVEIFVDSSFEVTNADGSSFLPNKGRGLFTSDTTGAV